MQTLDHALPLCAPVREPLRRAVAAGDRGEDHRELQKLRQLLPVVGEEQDDTEAGEDRAAGRQDEPAPFAAHQGITRSQRHGEPIVDQALGAPAFHFPM